MAKKRVYEYAKELDVPTKSVIDKAKELGIDYNSHMSSMEDKQVEQLNRIFVSTNKNGSTSTSSTKNQKGGNPITNQKNQSNQHSRIRSLSSHRLV